MFDNYSQTYAAAVTALAGFIVTACSLFGWHFAPANVQLVLGNLVTLGGLIWQIWHRYQRGDITKLGARK